jgi:hypothetical protein
MFELPHLKSRLNFCNEVGVLRMLNDDSKEPTGDHEMLYAAARARSLALRCGFYLSSVIV